MGFRVEAIAESYVRRRSRSRNGRSTAVARTRPRSPSTDHSISSGAPVPGERLLDAGPVELDPGQSAGRPARLLLARERAAADEVRLGEVDQAVEADLERRVLVLRRERRARARVVDLDQDQAGLDAGHVHRPDAARAQAVIVAGG